MDSGEEPTEVTAMTGESGMAEDSSSVPRDATSRSTPLRHRKALLTKFMRSPQGKCVSAIILITALIMASYVVSKIVMGSMFISSCPLEQFIPIYLVTSASLLITFIVVLVIIIIKCRREENDDRVSPVHLVTFVYFFIHLVLQLAGSVCVIRTRNLLMDTPLDDLGSDSASCDDILLTYSFGVVIFELILSGLLFIFAVISLCEIIYIECCQAPKHAKPATIR